MLADLAIAFVAGLVSCASACVLPLLPPFVAYVGGVSARSGARRPPLAVLASAGLFVSGFATCFVALGAAAGLAGAGLATYRPALVTASGAVLVLLGVGLLAGVPWLMREWRFHVAHRLPRVPLASYVVGLAFAAGWTPCVGPVLAAILVLAAGTATAVRGALLLAAYSAGLGLPFLAAAAFVGAATALLKRIRGVYPALNAVAAVFLIVMGALTLTNRLSAVNVLFPDLAPAVRPAALTAPVPAPAVPNQLLGQPVPAVTVADTAGRRLGLRGLAGRPVVVNFWASWCVPCQQELPLFDTAARAHRDEGLTVVPIDYQESPETVKRFWQSLGLLELTPFLDPDGRAARAFGVGLQATGLPLTVLVDRDGRVRAALPGQVDPGLFSARLGELLAPVTRT